MITAEQLKTLQDKITALVADKADADAKTQTSNEADLALRKAGVMANQAKLDEASADAKATADLADLRSFIDGLVS